MISFVRHPLFPKPPALCPVMTFTNYSAGSSHKQGRCSQLGYEKHAMCKKMLRELGMLSLEKKKICVCVGEESSWCLPLPASPHPVLVQGVASSQVQESVHALVKLHKILAGTVLQPIAAPLNHSLAWLPAHQLLPTIWCHAWNWREYAQCHKSSWWTRWFMYCQPLKTHVI